MPFLFCQVCIIYYISALSSPSKPLPPLESKSVMFTGDPVAKRWALIVHTSY